MHARVQRVQKLYDKNKIGDGNKNMFLSQWKLILQRKHRKLAIVFCKNHQCLGAVLRRRMSMLQQTLYLQPQYEGGGGLHYLHWNEDSRDLQPPEWACCMSRNRPLCCKPNTHTHTHKPKCANDKITTTFSKTSKEVVVVPFVKSCPTLC